MALKHSTGLQNFILGSGFATAFDTNGRISFYNGSVPANGDAAFTGTLLAECALSSDAFGSASSGAIAANSISNDTSVNASGTPTCFCMWVTTQTDPASSAGGSDRRLIGTVGTSGSDINFDSVTWVAGGVVAVSGFTYNYAD